MPKTLHAICNSPLEWNFNSGRTYSDPFNEIEVDVVQLTPLALYNYLVFERLGKLPPEDEFDRAMVAERSIFQTAFLRRFEIWKPIIAAVNGAALAGGMEILQATDIRVAGESARFGVSEARWGLFPLGGSAVRLPRQIPYTIAADLLLTGRHITAAEALEIGLIGRVVPDGQALAKALEIAETIAANGPVAVRAILRAIRETEGMPENDAFAVEAKIGMEVFRSEDAKEGPRAFAEKRRPQFQDR